MISRVFVGTDLRQPVAFNVLQHSIHMAAQRPVQVIPLLKHQLPITRFGLTDFTYSRYLVPWLCNYTGRALFMDADMLVLDDINGLFDWADGQEDDPDVRVVQEQDKFEWPSLMLFNNPQCRNLYPEWINADNTKPQELKWASTVGMLPKEWNVMVKASEPDIRIANAKVLHFTEGLPCFFETQHTPGASIWQQIKRDMNHTVTWKELMGRSIHAQPVLKRMLQGYMT